jgi:hypothetical protein
VHHHPKAMAAALLEHADALMAVSHRTAPLGVITWPAVAANILEFASPCPGSPPSAGSGPDKVQSIVTSDRRGAVRYARPTSSKAAR